MDMQTLVDELDSLVRRAIHVPATGKVLMDRAALREIIVQLQRVAPDEVRFGQRIAGERERILADARSQARRILEDAQAQVHRSLDEQATVQAARQRARDVVSQAEQRANILRADADQYVIGQLGALEARLQRLLREVQAGQRFLAQEKTERPEGGAQS